jgi:hypothetical protein
MSGQSRQVKLAFANAMHQLNTTDCDGSGSEAFQTQHDTQLRLNTAVVLLDQVV